MHFQSVEDGGKLVEALTQGGFIWKRSGGEVFRRDVGSTLKKND